MSSATVRLLDAAVNASRAGDEATAATHLLAAAQLLDLEGRHDDARQARALAAADPAVAALQTARAHGAWTSGVVTVRMDRDMFVITAWAEVIAVSQADEAQAVRVVRRLLRAS